MTFENKKLTTVDKDNDGDVHKIQKGLKTLGLDPGNIDGKYGSRTEAAVLAFKILYNQEHKGKPITVNGIVDTDTITAMNEYLTDTKKLNKINNDLKTRSFTDAIIKSYAKKFTKKDNSNSKDITAGNTLLAQVLNIKKSKSPNNPVTSRQKEKEITDLEKKIADLGTLHLGISSLSKLEEYKKTLADLKITDLEKKIADLGTLHLGISNADSLSKLEEYKKKLADLKKRKSGVKSIDNFLNKLTVLDSEVLASIEQSQQPPAIKSGFTDVQDFKKKISALVAAQRVSRAAKVKKLTDSIKELAEDPENPFTLEGNPLDLPTEHDKLVMKLNEMQKDSDDISKVTAYLEVYDKLPDNPKDATAKEKKKVEKAYDAISKKTAYVHLLQANYQNQYVQRLDGAIDELKDAGDAVVSADDKIAVFNAASLFYKNSDDASTQDNLVKFAADFIGENKLKITDILGSDKDSAFAIAVNKQIEEDKKWTSPI
ncbi:MAG: hypothetical protein GXP63_00075 [DPANN group archaeon]|nr:hypothetical protein [DPANN group archaeon]